MTTERWRPPVQPSATRQVRLALADEAGQQQPEQLFELRKELLGLGPVEDVLPHRLVAAGKRTKLVHPMRVRQEPAVEDEVDVDREPVLVPEGHHADLHPGVS